VFLCNSSGLHLQKPPKFQSYSWSSKIVSLHLGGENCCDHRPLYSMPVNVFQQIKADRMAHYKGASKEASRAMNLIKKRQKEQEELEMRKRKIEDELKLGTISNKFAAHYDAVETKLKSGTVGMRFYGLNLLLMIVGCGLYSSSVFRCILQNSACCYTMYGMETSVFCWVYEHITSASQSSSACWKCFIYLYCDDRSADFFCYYTP